MILKKKLIMKRVKRQENYMILGMVALFKVRLPEDDP
jgi:hypothetical protein